MDGTATAEPGTIVAAVDGTALRSTDDDAIRERVDAYGRPAEVTE